MRRPRVGRRSILAAIAVLVTVVLLVAVVGATTVLRRSYATLDGESRLLGLEQPAQVYRDPNGVPHIYAQTEHDLLFLQGYVTASDRLFELEFLRRIGQARLSEIFGAATLDTDKFVRTLGWYRVARQEAAALAPDTRAAIAAYAAGVNKYAETHRDAPPIEFLILGVGWEPWDLADTVVVGKIMAWDLSGNMESELLRENVAARVGDAALATLFPPLPVSTPAIFSRAGDGAVAWDDVARAPGAAGLRALLGGGFGAEIGSNNWVVSGARTTTGKPLLANDPHLGVRNPSIWYLNHLSGGGLDVAGYSIPGAPGVVIGHNQRIAWGVTNLGPDVQDLYVERADPADPRKLRFGDTSYAPTVFRDEIRVKGADPVTIEIVETRHGPVITPVLEGVKETLSLRWTALEPGHLIDALYHLDRAANWNEFRAALRDWDVPGQNFVYADVDGHIGYQATGKIPLRSGQPAPFTAEGDRPQPGWDGAHEWRGYIPFDDLPSRFDPAEGIIVTANQRIVSEFPAKISTEFDPGFRAERIQTLLRAKDRLAADDLSRVQLDVVDASAETFLAFLRTMPVRSERAAEAQQILAAWDGAMRADRVAPTIYWAWQLHMLDRTFRDKLGDDVYEDYRGYFARAALYDMARTPSSPWFVVLADPIHHGRDDLAALALDDALDELSKKLGPDLSTWQWGKLHTITFPHPLGAVLPWLFNLGPYANSGSFFTVNNGPFSPKKPYAQTSHPSMRMVVDLADLEAMRVILPTGQAGQPFARHWGDMTEKYLAGGYATLRFATAKQGPLEGTLSFKPN